MIKCLDGPPRPPLRVSDERAMLLVSEGYCPWAEAHRLEYRDAFGLTWGYCAWTGNFVRVSGEDLIICSAERLYREAQLPTPPDVRLRVRFRFVPEVSWDDTITFSTYQAPASILKITDVSS